MGTANTFRSDLNALHNIVQNTLQTHPKETFIESLREFFSQDSYYHYVRDEWGFPQTPDLTGMPLEAGYSDDTTTRIFIGEPYRQGVIYYPALLVRPAGARFVPISFNNEQGSVQWEAQRFVDGYGNETIIQTPAYFIKAGAWEGSVNIEIEAKSPQARDELADLVSAHFVELRRQQLERSGVFVKGVTQGSTSETDDRNDKLFKQTITCEIRSEWRREIPITSVIDMINICVDFGNVETVPHTLAPNLRVATTVELVEALVGL
jgi:hypothetical protein